MGALCGAVQRQVPPDVHVRQGQGERRGLIRRLASPWPGLGSLQGQGALLRFKVLSDRVAGIEGMSLCTATL